MLEAIRRRQNWRRSNTEVKIMCGGAVAAVYLHNNLIAVLHLNAGLTYTSSAGWRTPTTKSRLNALLERHGIAIHQVRGTWYWDSGTMFSDSPVQSILNDFCSQYSKVTRDRNLFVA